MESFMRPEYRLEVDVVSARETDKVAVLRRG